MGGNESTPAPTPHQKGATVSSVHVMSLTNQQPEFENEGGTIQSLDSTNWPLLNGQKLSLRRLLLNPSAVREPHWHVDANELAYCVSGEALVTLFVNGSKTDSFTVTAGQMYFVPGGALHSIDNVGSTVAEFIVGFTDANPQEFGIADSFTAFSDAVLGNTYSVPADTFTPLRTATRPGKISIRTQPTDVPHSALRTSQYRFDVDAMTPPVNSPSGSARTARKQFWPILEGISMYSLDVTDDGMREPHWHPVTTEMGYVHKGRARMTILNPGGAVDTYELEAGDVYIVPSAYPHHIEDIGDDDIHFCIFFDNVMPQDIGYRAAIGGWAPEVLQAAFGLDTDVFASLPFTAQDPLIVPRVNPVDPAN